MMKYLIVGLCLPTFAAMGPSLAANVSDDYYTAIRVNDLLAKFLLTTQRPDGSWRVVSHLPKFQTYFTTGFRTPATNGSAPGPRAGRRRLTPRPANRRQHLPQG